MDKGDFQKVLRRYLRGDATEEEARMIDIWYNNMEKASDSFFSEEERAELKKRYWSRIRSQMQSLKNSGGGSLWRWYSIGLAASALLIMVSYLDISSGKSLPALSEGEEKRSELAFERIENQSAHAEIVKLPDGSTVTLEPKSNLKYVSAFGERERKVYLDGKAFFDVVHDKGRPFKVCTSNVITKVLGTSFTVSAFESEKDVTVSVQTGKVSVYTRMEDRERTKADEIILTPNQEFIYDKNEQRVIRSIVREPKAIIPPEEVKRMRFEETTSKVVFEAIEKVYGVDIVFDENKFSTCRITTSISDGHLFNRLHIICEVINATYRIEENKILIEGDGCQTHL
jgi:ferric-dicitrate binding protein FerR (iron transport regulator)